MFFVDKFKMIIERDQTAKNVCPKHTFQTDQGGGEERDDNDSLQKNRLNSANK